MTEYKQAGTLSPFGVIIEQPDSLEGNIHAQFIDESRQMFEDLRQRGSALGVDYRSDLSNSERVLNIIKSLPEADTSLIEKASADFDGALSRAHLENPVHYSDFTAEPLSPEDALSTIISMESLGVKLGEAYQKAVSPNIEDQPVYFDAEFGEYFNDTPSTALPDEQAEIVDNHVREFEYQYSRFVEGRTGLEDLLSENQRIRTNLQYGDHGMSQQDTQTALENYDRRAGPFVALEIEANYPELEQQMLQMVLSLEELADDIMNDEVFTAYKTYSEELNPKYAHQIDSFSFDQKNALYEKLADFKSMALDVVSLHNYSSIEIPEIQLNENFLAFHHDVESELALDLGDRMYFDNSQSNYEARQEMRYALTPPPKPEF